jgi:tetratricopeptide (TPR) repeat protein
MAGGTGFSKGRKMTERPGPKLRISELARGLVPVLFVAFVATFAGACGSGGYGDSSNPGAQVEFGVDMARQGLWDEALFRFRQADRMDPDNPRILNNLAVALEASGDYDSALEAYQRAVRLAPSNRDLTRNYARFAEFYQRYQSEEGGEIDLEGFELLEGQSTESADSADETGGRP